LEKHMSVKTVLITGCSSGIGYCAAKGLQDRGYRVFATARKAVDIERLQAEGFSVLALDLDDSDSIQACVDELLRLTGGTIDAVFNNAAFGQTGAVEDLRREVLKAQFETNLFGTHELTVRLLPVMRRQGHGRIVQNSSVLGLTAMPFRGAYNASKFALEGLTDTLRLELRGTGIHISLIEPGPILSQFRANALTAFKQNIDSTTSPFQDAYAKTLQRLEKPGATTPFTLGPEAVLKRLIHALESPRPKARYYVTVPTYAFAYLRRLLPTWALDRLVAGRG
jgi:NAD(P)-dependent dehydrogenase (short-subunit alcohol dehydrogenase family)